MTTRRFPSFVLFLALLLCAAPHARAQQTRPRTALPAQTPSQTTVAVPTLTPTPTPAPFEGVAAQASAYHAPFAHGILVQRRNGETIIEQGTDQLFNPASAVKLATSLVALRTLGPDYRFPVGVWMTGTFDRPSGTITGDLIISGRDPSFHYEHAVSVARELNLMGVRTVTGDLIIAPRFTMNFNASSLRSGERLYDTLDSTRRPAAATRAWLEARAALKDAESLMTTPSVAVMGAVYVDSVPPGATHLLTHNSSTLVDILKVLLCYSNNFMAERLGDTLGGAPGVEQYLERELHIAPAAIRLASTSGLGVNRLSPREMMKIYLALVDELREHNLKASDILPVAGIDPGTLSRRYAAHPARGSIIAKTGTLVRTDGGASALVGEFRAQNGETLYFVIFNQRGNVTRFRSAQDNLLYNLQLARGGPAQFPYSPQTLAMRLVDTEYNRAAATDEYEPMANE
ncbi:MAG TPA: D-alanyl-D-alanine carboxypeptidase [Pyrinomonadaceae bacterium]|nr:D-alanyl-D-alanine carboxypeptidase [Pyrinomonadaceae bacterium]